MAEVRYAEETTGGILRHASFQGLREDKMAPPAPPEPGAWKRALPDPIARIWSYSSR